VWYHRFGPLAGKAPVPRVSELYSVTLANTAAALLALGAAGLVGSIALGSGASARAAAAVFAAGVVTEGFQMLRLSRRKP